MDTELITTIIFDAASLVFRQYGSTVSVSTADGSVLATVPGSTSKQPDLHAALRAACTASLPLALPDGRFTVQHVGIYVPRVGMVCIGDTTFRVGACPIPESGVTARCAEGTLHVNGRQFSSLPIGRNETASAWSMYSH